TYCLGDVVGYGPNPRECVDLVMKCKIVLLGNHDQGAMFDPEGFNPPAERAIFWTRAQLESPSENRVQKERRWEFLAERPRSPEEIDYLYRLDGRKTLCNVGSVGQPRDGDWRACYILLDGDTIRYRRVEYDIDTTVKKIYAIPDLENFLGDRLRDGR